jgi:hypothetical protein
MQNYTVSLLECIHRREARPAARGRRRYRRQPGRRRLRTSAVAREKKDALAGGRGAGEKGGDLQRPARGGERIL